MIGKLLLYLQKKITVFLAIMLITNNNLHYGRVRKY